MKRELRLEVKRLAKNHITSAVAERILPESLDLMWEWAGETIRKLSVDISEQESEEVLNAIQEAYILEMIRQLGIWQKRY